MNFSYRRLHALLASTVSSITVIEEVAYILSMLPFGAKIAVDR